jgi:putative membrane protein
VVSVRAADLFDTEQRHRIEHAVRDAERATRGEIVVAVVRSCDEYAAVGWKLGVFAAAFVFAALHAFAPPLPWWGQLAAQAAAVGASLALARVDAVRRALLSEALVDRRVHERARRCFAENGLTRTQGRTGVLLFVALLEHRVVVLGDEGIDRVLDPGESWQQVVDRAVAGLRGGRPTEGIEAAVHRAGEILAHHVPADAERNPDELPDALVIEA